MLNLFNLVGKVAAVTGGASLLSFQRGIRIASYTASKSGLAGLTRLLEPSDLAGAALFLASATPDYVHGALLPVDGGRLAR